MTRIEKTALVLSGILTLDVFIIVIGFLYGIVLPGESPKAYKFPLLAFNGFILFFVLSTLWFHLLLKRDPSRGSALTTLVKVFTILTLLSTPTLYESLFFCPQ